MRVAIAYAQQNIIVNLRLQRSMAYLDVNAQIICSYTYFLDNCNFSGFFSSFLIELPPQQTTALDTCRSVSRQLSVCFALA